MARILFFVFLAFLVWLVVRMAGAQRTRGSGRAPVADATRDPESRSASAMHEPVTQCAWCGAHVPVGTALALPDGRVYCSGMHREQARLAMARSDGGS